jgi:FAD/FMN-containing dehydrogenase
MMLSGWGRYPRLQCAVHAPRDEDALRDLVSAKRLIARGNGRAYGDSALSATNTVELTRFNRMLAFDPASGQLVTEAGVLLEHVIAAFLPIGWFPSVTPGTKFVTIGGMIAADVHGKNHHLDGSFGNFVDWIELMGPDGLVRRCSPTENSDLFHWSVGGMGLTGVILRAAFRLRPVETSWIRQTIIPAASLEAAIEAFEANRTAAYSVAWIDCLSGGSARGRSLVILGEHACLDELPSAGRDTRFATRKERRMPVPFAMPAALFNRATVAEFNALYYWNGARHAGSSLVDWDSYFYPLDGLEGWNRIYGRQGFVQFQCVLPLAASLAGLTEILRVTEAAGSAPFLAVLKRMGLARGGISFPMEGYTLTMDFPATARNLALLAELHHVTITHQGRIYLAKDGCTTAEAVRQADPRIEEFASMRARCGLRAAFASAQSERLEI